MENKLFQAVGSTFPPVAIFVFVPAPVLMPEVNTVRDTSGGIPAIHQLKV